MDCYLEVQQWGSTDDLHLFGSQLFVHWRKQAACLVNPLAIGAHDHGRIAVAHLFSDIKWVLAGRQQRGSEGVPRLVEIPVTHLGSLEHSGPEDVEAARGIPAFIGSWIMEDQRARQICMFHLSK